MFLLVPFAFWDRGISFKLPAAPAGIGPDWPLQLLTSLWGARGTRTRRRHGLSLVNVRTVSYLLLTVHRPVSTVAGSRLAAPDARSVSRGSWDARLSASVIPPPPSPAWLLRRSRWLLPIPPRSGPWLAPKPDARVVSWVWLKIFVPLQGKTASWHLRMTPGTNDFTCFPRHGGVTPPISNLRATTEKFLVEKPNNTFCPTWDVTQDPQAHQLRLRPRDQRGSYRWYDGDGDQINHLQALLNCQEVRKESWKLLRLTHSKQ